MYRIKQFIWALSSNLKPIDYNFLNKYLNKKEKRIFKELKVSEQQHSIRVCKKALDRCNDKTVDKYKLAKIALLHDIGKINKPLNILDKSVIVILDKITGGKLKNFKGEKIDIYYNHPSKSVKILSKISKYDGEFLEAIENHHFHENSSNIYLNIIKECDDLC